jgi:hypothetical protein
MKRLTRSFAVICMLFVEALSASPELYARDAALSSGALTAEQTAEQSCMNACRARYRDCRRLKQVPSFECRGVYQDCRRFSCTGRGPG